MISVQVGFGAIRLAGTPGGPAKRYYQKLAWASASFAILADIDMGTLGGSLKFKEKLTGRFADILSWMYLATATLRRLEAEGRKKEDLPYVDFAMTEAFANIQRGFDGIFTNLPALGPVWKFVFGPWSRLNRIGSEPTDDQSHALSAAIQTPGGCPNLCESEPITSKVVIAEGECSFTVASLIND